MKRIAITGFSAIVLLTTGPEYILGQRNTPAFQYVATAGGEFRASSTPYAAHPGSRQLIYFSNDKLTIAPSIEVKDIPGGVALVRVKAKSYPGKVERETSQRELKSALPHEYVDTGIWMDYSSHNSWPLAASKSSSTDCSWTLTS